MNGSHIPMAPLGLTETWDRAGAADWADVLAEFPLFSGIAGRRLRALVRHATFAEYGPGDVVVQKNEPGDSLYVILGGSAQVRGKPAARRLRTGDYFGELGLLSGAPRSATVVAAGELHVMKLPRDAFLRVAQHEPAIALELLGTLGARFLRLEARAA
jgi:CRP-like cAMP-binding protein